MMEERIITKEVSLNVSGPILKDKLFFWGFQASIITKTVLLKMGTHGDEENDEAHWYGKGQLKWTPTDSP